MILQVYIALIFVLLSLFHPSSALTTAASLVDALKAAGVTEDVAEPVAGGLLQLVNANGLSSEEAAFVVTDMADWANSNGESATQFSQAVANSDLGAAYSDLKT